MAARYLHGMLDGVLNKVEDVVVLEAVEDGLSIAATFEKPSRMQDLQAGRYRPDFSVLCPCNFRDGHFSRCKQHEDAQPGGIAERPEDGSRKFNLFVVTVLNSCPPYHSNEL